MVSSRRKILRLRDMRALVVDDSPFMCQLVTALMKTLGFGNVAHCTDGGDALLTLRSFPADIIVTDWAMKPMDGLQFLKAFTGLYSPGEPYPPVIMLTANTEREHVIAAREAGVSDLIAKPVSPTLVYNRVMRVLEQPKPVRAALAEAVEEEVWEL